MITLCSGTDIFLVWSDQLDFPIICSYMVCDVAENTSVRGAKYKGL